MRTQGPSLAGYDVLVSDFVPPGTVLTVERFGTPLLAVSEYDRYGDPFGIEGLVAPVVPLWTRYTLGAREARRDVRRRRRLR